MERALVADILVLRRNFLTNLKTFLGEVETAVR